jgi:N-methylhydantoinase A
MPGALSAYGILVSDVVKDYSRTVLWSVGRELPSTRLQQVFAELQVLAEKDFRAENWNRPVRYAKTVDVRYRGQGYELNVPYSSRLLRNFHQEHARRYGYSHPGRVVELVTLRLRAIIKSEQARVKLAAPRAPRSKGARMASTVLFQGTPFPTSIHERQQLAFGQRLPGPAIVTEYSATTVIPPGMSGELDRAGNLVITCQN